MNPIASDVLSTGERQEKRMDDKSYWRHLWSIRSKLIWFALTLVIVLAAARYRAPDSIHYRGICFPALNDQPVEPVLVDTRKRGFLPGVYHVFTHDISNARWSQRAYEVRFELVDCDLEVEWHVHTRIWDEEARSLTRPLQPGERFSGIHLVFHIPEDRMSWAIVYKGGLAVIDKPTGERLAFQPILIGRDLSRSRKHARAHSDLRQRGRVNTGPG